MKARNTIAVGVFIFGFLVCVGAVGHLDYMDACGERISDSDFLESCIRSAIGLISMVASFFIYGDIVETNDEPSKTGNPKPEEAEHLKNLGTAFGKNHTI